MPFLECTDSSAPSAGSSSEKGFAVLFRARQAGPQLSTGDTQVNRNHPGLDCKQGKGRPSPNAVCGWPPRGLQDSPNRIPRPAQPKPRAPETQTTAHGGSWGQGGTSGQACTWHVGRDKKPTVEPNSYQQTPCSATKEPPATLMLKI